MHRRSRWLACPRRPYPVEVVADKRPSDPGRPHGRTEEMAGSSAVTTVATHRGVVELRRPDPSTATRIPLSELAPKRSRFGVIESQQDHQVPALEGDAPAERRRLGSPAMGTSGPRIPVITTWTPASGTGNEPVEASCHSYDTDTGSGRRGPERPGARSGRQRGRRCRARSKDKGCRDRFRSAHGLTHLASGRRPTGSHPDQCQPPQVCAVLRPPATDSSTGP